MQGVITNLKKNIFSMLFHPVLLTLSVFTFLCISSKCSCCLLCPDLVLMVFDTFNKRVFFEQVKLKV